MKINLNLLNSKNMNTEGKNNCEVNGNSEEDNLEDCLACPPTFNANSSGSPSMGFPSPSFADNRKFSGFVQKGENY